jgi:hypothetical protein
MMIAIMGGQRALPTIQPAPPAMSTCKIMKGKIEVVHRDKRKGKRRRVKGSAIVRQMLLFNRCNDLEWDLEQ